MCGEDRQCCLCLSLLRVCMCLHLFNLMSALWWLQLEEVAVSVPDCVIN